MRAANDPVYGIKPDNGNKSTWRVKISYPSGRVREIFALGSYAQAIGWLWADGDESHIMASDGEAPSSITIEENET